jgi:uncharacterized protein (TIGR03546 family)
MQGAVMLLWIFTLYRSIRAALLGKATTRQLAWGIALGVVLGLIPKGNLLVPSLAVFVLFLNVNYVIAFATAALITVSGGWTDPLTHSIGQTILQQPDMREMFTKLQQLPLIPWFDLNNTVVLGSFLLGVALLLPVYQLALPMLKLLRKPPRDSCPPTPRPVSTAELRFDGPSAQMLETYIDVVRLRKVPEAPSANKSPKKLDLPQNAPSETSDALRYLVRHARETSEEKAA